MTRAFQSFAIAVLLFFFMDGAAMAYAPIKAAAISPGATMIKVHIGAGEKAIDADVTDASEIAALLGFINTHLEGWRFVTDTPPVAEVNLTFFDGKKPVGTFGSDATFFARGNPASLTHSASAKDITDFLNLADIDPAKLANPPHD